MTEVQADDGPTFEQARAELEQVVRRLEDGNTSLDEALALWERGEELYRICAAKLDVAEERVATLADALQGARPADQPSGSGPT
jgi:exodeoxyribonuclease VII small subunit